MSEALERLQKIGVDKIAEDTHIPREQLQAILEENFKNLTKVQFIGFVSILEREYGEDLTELRERFITYFNEKNDNNELLTDDIIFKSSEKKIIVKPLYLSIMIAFFAVAFFYYRESSQNPLQKNIQETKIITEAKKHLLKNKRENENNVSTLIAQESDIKDLNESKIAAIPEVIEKPKVITHTFEIIARKKVWLGYIDVAKHKKYQKVFTGKFSLDPTKEWLLFFGHGMIDLVVDGKQEKFTNRNRVRFYYKDGNVSEISVDKFKLLNRGKTW